MYSMQENGMMQGSGPADVDGPVSSDDWCSVGSANPANAAIRASPLNSMPSPGKQYSHPHANLNQRPLRPCQQTGRETNIKEVSELETCTLNSNGKHDRTAMAT